MLRRTTLRVLGAGTDWRDASSIKREELFFLERLLDEIERAVLHRLHRHRHVAVAGDEDDREASQPGA